MLPDSFEVTNFTVGGKQWSLNPTKTDSNDDGLNDFIELPPTDVQLTINNVITTTKVGAAPVNTASASRYDWDNDGMPNVWDDDNDGDGVIDSLDLSPFGVGSQQKEFRISSKGGGYTGTQYIEVQLQPQDLSHLRYGLTAFDWPKDEKGAMKDYEGVGKGLVRLQPFMEVIVNEAAMPRTYAKDYGVSVREDFVSSGYKSFYVGLQPIGNGGAINAFYSKIAFAPGELNSIDLRARLVWFVQGDSQTNISGTITSNSTLLHVYKDETARVTGLKITKSEQAETLIVGDPNSPQEDRYLAAAAVGMNMFYLGAGIVPTPTAGLSTLEEAANRFNTPSIARDLRFTIPNTVTLPAERVAYAHSDLAIRGLGQSVTPFLNANNFASAPATCDDGKATSVRCASLLVAMDERTGDVSLEDLPSSIDKPTAGDDLFKNNDTFQRYTVSLNAISNVSRRKSLKLSLYENIGGEWKTLTLARSPSWALPSAWASSLPS